MLFTCRALSPFSESATGYGDAGGPGPDDYEYEDGMMF